MDIEDLLELLDVWLASEPKVRGHEVEDAELRLRPYGEGRLAVALRSKNPEAEFRAVGIFLLETLEAVKAKEAGEIREDPTPPCFPDKACADFSSIDDLEQILRGETEGTFFFDDEIDRSGDPLRE